MKNTLSKQFIRILVIGVLLFQSCVSNKQIIYLQDTNDSADTVYHIQPNDYRLQKGDLIGIDVKLATSNPALKDIFSGSAGGMNGQMGAQGGGDMYYMSGYAVDDSGYVEVPVIGKVVVLGLNIAETNKAIQGAFDQYLTNAFITVRFGGLRYSALGEVRRPGKYVILQNRMTIFEAIANAGDLTELAKRDQVRIIRQYPDGTRIHVVNLLDEKLISSPFYYIQPNDVIYVEPLKIRAIGTGTNGLQTFQAIVTTISGAVAIIGLFNLFK